MTRAYIRLDPAFDERKADYPDGPYAALIACFCTAELQPLRGSFRSLAYLKVLLGKRGRHVKYLVDHGDLIVLPDGRVYVDGWTEWQEGDWRVGERMARLRHRLHRNKCDGPDRSSKNPAPYEKSAGAGADLAADRNVGNGFKQKARAHGARVPE